MLPIAKFQNQFLGIHPKMANRHGLVAGATGTGKTVTLQSLAESFSSIGVPVFMADVKGDLAGIAKAGGANPKVTERFEKLGMTPIQYTACPVAFWDVFGQSGHPVRATISEMGPLLLSRILDLNDTQAGVLSIVFQVADDNGLLLLDLKDLRALLQFAADNPEVKTRYGNVSSASVAAISRSLLTLEQQGGDKLFGEPALDLWDLMKTDSQGKGVINILAADKLMLSPKMYAMFLLWLLSELFEAMPEIGDPEKPKFVFFFDEAHLLFNDAPKALLERIEQVVRLIRSKGVGIYFISQNPLDIPDTVLGQLGNRVQHALRAFTPRDQKAVKTAADTFRQNPNIDTQKAITELAVGEALISFLDEKGTPNVVERALVCPPKSFIGPCTVDERQTFIKSSMLFGKYEKVVDRQSAYEILTQRAQQQAPPQQTSSGNDHGGFESVASKRRNQNASAGGYANTRQAPAPRTSNRQTPMEAMAKSAMRSIGSTVGRQIARGILGSILGGRR